MSPVRRIICLANSKKLDEQCVAGIDMIRGSWVRPVCDDLYPEDGRIPMSITLVNDKGMERKPELLDILEIPLATTGNDFSFASENLTILNGKWQFINRTTTENVISYCKNYPHILHNPHKYVTVDYLKSLPKQERRTLQLVYVREFLVTPQERAGRISWRGTIQAANGQKLTDIPITDPILIKHLATGYQPQSPCLVTFSLSMPHRPDGWEGEPPCWKLIAGIIELTQSTQILAEMNRLNWSIDQGRAYLVENFKKQSRSQLTDSELLKFLNYLKILPDPYYSDVGDYLGTLPF
jgi:hypothetical protein